MTNFKRYYLVLLVLLIGLAGSIVGFRLFLFIEETENQKDFVLAATDRLVAIERSIQSNLDSVLSIKSYFESNSLVQREQFRSFVAPMLESNKAIKALEWVPFVAKHERNSFETIAKVEGFKDFTFIERAPNGELVGAGPRDDYFPVFYVEPQKGNESVFGFDMGSSISRRITLETARDTGRIISSESVKLIQNGAVGVLLFAPIYDVGYPTHAIDLRRRHITGFAVSVIDIEKMIGTALSFHRQLRARGGIDFYLYDEDKETGDSLMHIYNSPDRVTGQAPVIATAAGQEGLFVTDTVEFGDRNWLIVARPVDPNFGGVIPAAAWGMLALGLILTLTFAVFIKSHIDRNRTVRELVVERTAELSAKSEQIELMHDITVIANEAESTEAATQTCIDLICQRLGWNVGHAYFTTSEKEPRLVPSELWFFDDANRYNIFKEITMQAEYSAGLGLPGRVFTTREPMWSSGHDTENKSPRRLEAEKLGLESGVALPVMLENDVVAVLEFFYDKSVGPDDSLVQSLAHIGAQLGHVYERAKVENLKSEFISTVSHELRTPLTSIKGSLGLIQSGVTGELSDSLNDMVKIAYNNSDRLVRLINDILDIEKIEVGKMEFNIEILDLAPLMERVVAENAGFADEYKVKLDLFNSLPDTKIQADDDRLIQAITNLISNAVKFSPEGETVAVNVSARRQGIRISVADRGPGIAEEFRSRIFSKFAQADATDSRAQGGTGLGLSISKAIVEEHFGQIGFDTVTGEGTTFYIDLPIHHERRQSARTHTPEVTNTARVLIVEDDRDIAKLLELMLIRDGVKADIAYTAGEAKQALAERSYDAMTLDLALPDQDGISLVQEIRQAKKTRDLPIVVVSATAVEGKKELNGNSFGIIDWIQKPIDQAHLNDTLLRAIQGGSAGKPQILHVEDDLDVARVVATLVDDMAVITLATNLADGKKLLKSKKFDLVILDLMLPDGAGEELLSAAHENTAEPPPFIVFSAKEIPSSAVSNDIKAALVKSLTSNEQLVLSIRTAIETT